MTPATPKNIVIKGCTIPDITQFRYGQQLHDHRFFELRFRQSLIGGPFSLGTDTPASYINQSIKLQFEGAFGKNKSISGTIVKLEYISIAGQNAEVVVSGTMYQPTGSVSKFALTLMALIMFPVLFAGFLFWHISQMSDTIVKTEGTVSYFQDRAAKSTHNYTFKISPYHASFHRRYHAPVFNTAGENIDAIFKTADGTNDESRTGQKVTFYTLKSDQVNLNNPGKEIDFFYIKSALASSVKFDYYYDLLIYTTSKFWFYFIWIALLILEVFFFTTALFFYKMHALDQQQKNRIIWFSCLLIAAILNISVLSLMI